MKSGSGRRRTAAWAGIELWAKRLGAVVAIVGIVSTAVVFLRHQADSVLGSDSLGNELEVSLVVVGDGSNYVGADVPLKAMPRLDVTVRNTGKEPVLLTGARVTIEDSAKLPVCRALPFTGPNWVPVSQHYPIELPVSPAAGERVISRPLHDQVPPGEVDRPLLAFRSSPSDEDDDLYLLHVELLTGQDRGGVDVGRFLVAVSRPPVPDGVSLPASGDSPGTMPAPGSPDLPEAWCFRRNLDSLGRLTAGPGRRSPKLAALADLPTADQWGGTVEPRAARAAVSRLLAPGNGEPQLAVFAAEATGDRRYVEETSQRAAAQLVTRAEQQLGAAEGGPSSAQSRGARAAEAILGLRAALEVVPSSSEAQALLGRAKDRLLAAEEGL